MQNGRPLGVTTGCSTGDISLPPPRLRHRLGGIRQATPTRWRGEGESGDEKSAGMSLSKSLPRVLTSLTIRLLGETNPANSGFVGSLIRAYTP